MSTGYGSGFSAGVGGGFAAGGPAPTGKVVLVTGATGGIGSAVARRFAAGGWRVAVSDLSPERLTAMVDQEGDGFVSGSGIEMGVAGDVRDVAFCRRAVDEVAAALGRLDALVNAAGVWVEGPAEDTTEDEWDQVLDVNAKGTYFLTSAAIPHLEATEGCVVNLSSDAGVQGNAGAAVYSASKGAVTNMTRALALELAPRGIRVNAVCPGDVDTPMLRLQAQRYGQGMPERYLADLLDQYPQGPSRARFLRADEIAEVVWFLAQPAAAGVTGANWSVDFGLSAGI